MSTTLVISIGAIGGVARFIRQHGRPDALIYAPWTRDYAREHGNTPARRNYEDDQSHAEAVSRYFGDMADYVSEWVLTVAEQAHNYDRVVVVVNALAVANDPKAGIYPTVCSPDVLAEIREIADEVIKVG